MDVLCSDGNNTSIGLVGGEGKVYDLGDGKRGAPHQAAATFLFQFVKYRDLLYLKLLDSCIIIISQCDIGNFPELLASTASHPIT
jgi:hypothetical protein